MVVEVALCQPGLSAITGKADTVYPGASTSSQTVWDTTVDKAAIATPGAGAAMLVASHLIQPRPCMGAVGGPGNLLPVANLAASALIPTLVAMHA